MENIKEEIENICESSECKNIKTCTKSKILKVICWTQIKSGN